MSTQGDNMKNSHVIMRVYQPTIAIDETKPPRMISGLVESIPTQASLRAKKARTLKSKGSEDAKK